MNLLEDYNALVQTVKKHFEDTDQKSTDDVLAKRLGLSRQYFVNLKNGHAKLNKDHITLFKTEFRTELNLSESLTEMTDPATDSAIISANIELLASAIKEIGAQQKLITTLLALFTKEQLSTKNYNRILSVMNGDLQDKEILDLIADIKKDELL